MCTGLGVTFTTTPRLAFNYIVGPHSLGKLTPKLSITSTEKVAHTMPPVMGRGGCKLSGLIVEIGNARADGQSCRKCGHSEGALPSAWMGLESWVSMLPVVSVPRSLLIPLYSVQTKAVSGEACPSVAPCLLFLISLPWHLFALTSFQTVPTISQLYTAHSVSPAD